MGSCNTKKKVRDNNPFSISSAFKLSTLPDINNGHNSTREGISMKSNFFFFTDWIVSYKFFVNLNNDDQNTQLITMANGPNDKNIFKVIKALDQINEKDFSEFTNSLSLQLRSEFSKQTKPQSYTVSKQLTNNSSNGLNGLSQQLSDDELKLTVIHLFERLNMFKPKKMKKLLIQGPPNNLRWLMWISIARSRYMDIENKIEISNEQIFQYLINSSYKEAETENRIKNDLLRTKLELNYFRGGKWTIALSNMLKAIALYDEQLGYYVGMNEIAANALIVSDCNEIECFNLLRFIYSNEYGLKLRDFYINGFPKMKFYCFLIYELIKERMPKIYKVIDDNKIVNEMWLQKCLHYLYGNILDFSVGIRLWDCLISLGSEFLVNFSLGYVKYYEEQILQCKNVKDFLELFKEKKIFKTNNEIIDFREKLIKLSFDFHISPQTYDRIQKKYNAYIDRENRTSLMRNALKHLHPNNRKELILMKIEKAMNSSPLNNDEAEKMRRIIKNIRLPPEQRESIFVSPFHPKKERHILLTEVNQIDNNHEENLENSIISNNSDEPEIDNNYIVKDIKDGLFNQNEFETENAIENIVCNNEKKESNVNNTNNNSQQTSGKETIQESELDSDDEIIENVDESNVDDDNKNIDDTTIVNFSNGESSLYINNKCKNDIVINGKTNFN